MNVFVVQLLSRVRLCNPMDCSTPASPALHCLPEFPLNKKSVFDSGLGLQQNPGLRILLGSFVFIPTRAGGNSLPCSGLFFLMGRAYRKHSKTVLKKMCASSRLSFAAQNLYT